jgi:pantoate--beta-alanine ligase
LLIESTIAGVRSRLRDLRRDGARVALVPTMGALHAGHLALVDAARKAADVVAVSIFVNPLQFGPGEDLARYPRTPESDAASVAEHGATIVFTPTAEEMYGALGSRTTVTPPSFGALFEGAVRHGHFTGVLTVVAKLFNIVQPDVAIFGRKDLQQLSLIRAMVADLNFAVQITAIDTVRDSDGLALSSRNRYLDAEARRHAPALRAALVAAKNRFESGNADPAAIESAGRGTLAKDGMFDVDYLALVNETDFATPPVAVRGNSVVAAARIGGTRLIDNIQL